MSSSRDKILAAIANHKPPQSPLPDVETVDHAEENIAETFTNVGVSIGSKVFPVGGYPEIEEIIRKEFPEVNRIISKVASLAFPVEENWFQPDTAPHTFRNVDLAILEGKLGVAENSAIWITEKEMGHRVLPFICQHLALIIREEDLVQNMHEAYNRLPIMEEGFGTFIAGPSKTADIEQSLVLGAHGPRSLRVFILREKS